LVFHYLSFAKTKEGARLVKKHLDAEEFDGRDEEEKLALYKVFLSLGRESAKPWLQAEWMKSPKALFKSKAQSEKRLLLAKAVSQSVPALAKSVLELTPLESLSPELQAIFQKLHSRGGAKI